MHHPVLVRVRIVGMEEAARLDIALDQVDTRRKVNGGLGARSGACHAGQFEGSVILAARPEWVREEIRTKLAANPVSLSTAIRDGQIEAQVSYPVKSSLGSDQMRYLTGTIIIEPELVEGGAFPRIVEISSSSVSVGM